MSCTNSHFLSVYDDIVFRELAVAEVPTLSAAALVVLAATLLMAAALALRTPAGR